MEGKDEGMGCHPKKLLWNKTLHLLPYQHKITLRSKFVSVKKDNKVLNTVKRHLREGETKQLNHDRLCE